MRVPSSPATRFRLALWNEPVPFGQSSAGDQLIYSPVSGEVSGVQQSGEGSLPTIRVTIQDSKGVLAQQMRLYEGLHDQQVVIRVVWSGDLGSGIPTFEEDAVVVNSTVSMAKDVQQAVFVLGSQNLLRLRFPNRRYTPRTCLNQFGSARCGYPLALGNFSTCPRTVDACIERGADELALGLPVLHPRRGNFFLGMRRQSGVRV